jgi:hypothetical protein
VGTLEVGNTEQPSGITIYDKTTKEPYCMFIDNGEIIKTKGKCDATESTTPPIVEAPLINEGGDGGGNSTPLSEQPPVIEEAPVIEQSPAVEEPIVIEEVPVVEQPPVVEEPVIVEPPVVEEPVQVPVP